MTVETVYGHAGDWHLTCSVCGEHIYPGEQARIFEDSEGDYQRSECLTHEKQVTS